MKKAAILYSEYSPAVDAMINQLNNVKVECFTRLPDDVERYDLLIGINYNGNCDANLLMCHHSLLPAFAGDEPVKQAVLAGVKVLGITIFYTKPEKIIAQYPLIISNDAHFDDVERELSYLEQVIFPLVAKKILNNEVIDMENLIKNDTGRKCGSCSNKCRKCGECSH